MRMLCGLLYSRKMDVMAMDRMVTVSGPMARTQPKRLCTLHRQLCRPHQRLHCPVLARRTQACRAANH